MLNEDKKKLHSLGIIGILDIYKYEDFIRSTPFKLSITSTLFIMLLIYSLGSNVIVFFNNIIDISLSILPSIIGFGLGGYAIMISFSNQIMLDKMFSNQTKNKTPTLYQKTSSIFAFVLILQVSTLTLSVIIKTFSDLSIEINLMIYVITYIISFVLTFLNLWSFLVMIDLIKNIFNIGQAFHLSLLNDYEKRNK